MKTKIEKMIKQAAQGHDRRSYSDIMEQWIKLTYDINWTETMGPLRRLTMGPRGVEKSV
jgi:hypothetical protein